MAVRFLFRYLAVIFFISRYTFLIDFNTFSEKALQKYAFKIPDTSQSTSIFHYKKTVKQSIVIDAPLLYIFLSISCRHFSFLSPV